MNQISLKEINSEIKKLARQTNTNLNKINGQRKVDMFLDAIKIKRKLGMRVTLG